MIISQYVFSTSWYSSLVFLEQENVDIRVSKGASLKNINSGFVFESTPGRMNETSSSLNNNDYYVMITPKK